MGVDLDALSRAELEAMLAAGKEVRENVRVLARTGDTVVSEVLRGVDACSEWTHYPAGDVIDPVTHGLYYYHLHPSTAMRGTREHGHFHTFLRASGMPPKVRPAKVAGLARSEIVGEAMSHLIAIAVDNEGTPTRLFTTNRWVTGEVWYTGPDVIAMLGNFAIARATPSWPVNRWIGAMLRLFRPQIASLILARDDAVAVYKSDNVLEDRGLEVTSALDIDVERQIAALRVALAKRKRLPASTSAESLP
jgi:hypothetical protein